MPEPAPVVTVPGQKYGRVSSEQTLSVPQDCRPYVAGPASDPKTARRRVDFRIGRDRLTFLSRLVREIGCRSADDEMWRNERSD